MQADLPAAARLPGLVATVMSIAVASSIDPRNAAVSSGSASSPGGSACAGAYTRRPPRASGRYRRARSVPLAPVARW